MTDDPTSRGVGRPPASDLQSVEQVALDLMLREGYDAVSVADIASAASISRTTFFRYFGSKSGVVWAAFEVTIANLDRALRAEPRTRPTLHAVRHAVGVSTRTAIFDSDAWLERFWLLDGHVSLRDGALERWDRWRTAVASFIASRTRSSPDAVLPMVIAAAAQATFLAELRTSPRERDDREAFLEKLDTDLGHVFDAFEPLLAGSTRARTRRPVG